MARNSTIRTRKIRGEDNLNGSISCAMAISAPHSTHNTAGPRRKEEGGLAAGHLGASIDRFSEKSEQDATALRARPASACRSKRGGRRAAYEVLIRGEGRIGTAALESAAARFRPKTASGA